MQHKDETRKFIIGAPLLLVALFTFGFLLAHPAVSENPNTAASNATSRKKTADVVNQVTPVPLGTTTLPTLSTAPVAGASADSSSPVGASTVSPQSARGSGAAKTPNVDNASHGAVNAVNGLINRH